MAKINKLFYSEMCEDEKQSCWDNMNKNIEHSNRYSKESAAGLIRTKLVTGGVATISTLTYIGRDNLGLEEAGFAVIGLLFFIWSFLLAVWALSYLSQILFEDQLLTSDMADKIIRDELKPIEAPSWKKEKAKYSYSIVNGYLRRSHAFFVWGIVSFF